MDPPGGCLAQQREGKIELVPPTHITLHYLAQHPDVDSLLAGIVPADGPRHYVTKATKGDGGMVVMWHGDAGYETQDASAPGARHRLTISKAGYAFDDSGVS